MSDTEQQAPPPTAEPVPDVQPSTDAPSAIQPPVPDVAPKEPPPFSDVAPAGVDAPGAAPQDSPGAEALRTDAPLIDTPVAALQHFGPESGVPEGTDDEITPVSDVANTPEPVVEPNPEHPYETIQRLRTKLAAYGEECLKTVQSEVEYLLSLCDPDAH